MNPTDPLNLKNLTTAAKRACPPGSSPGTTMKIAVSKQTGAYLAHGDLTDRAFETRHAAAHVFTASRDAAGHLCLSGLQIVSTSASVDRNLGSKKQ